MPALANYLPFCLAILPLAAQAPSVGPVRVAHAACSVHFKGKLDRSTVQLRSGAPPVSIQTAEEFDVTVQGRLEQWEPAPGAAEFRFVPEPSFASAQGTFRTSQNVTRPMQQTATTVEGSTVGGMGTWYLHAANVGGQIIPQNTNLTMRGKVTTSTDPNLPAGKDNVPVSVLLVPIVMSSGQQPTMPPLKFSGPSLWTLTKTKASFVADTELTFLHRGERDSLRGTVKIAFHVDPTK